MTYLQKTLACIINYNSGMTWSFGARPCSHAWWWDAMMLIKMFPHTPRYVEWLLSIVSIYVCRLRTYHIAKNASNSRLTCVLPITSQKFLLALKKRNIEKRHLSLYLRRKSVLSSRLHWTLHSRDFQVSNFWRKEETWSSRLVFVYWWPEWLLGFFFSLASERGKFIYY